MHLKQVVESCDTQLSDTLWKDYHLGVTGPGPSQFPGLLFDPTAPANPSTIVGCFLSSIPGNTELQGALPEFETYILAKMGWFTEEVTKFELEETRVRTYITTYVEDKVVDITGAMADIDTSAILPPNLTQRTRPA
ncbi:hypothetical protein HXX76_014116 [Chlamydomonas incerta]|uniref:Uncharacterized protein n=1 Tax=Chlamydomonas incerta TaxID=51695 RepID=A0A835SCW2_CHLIN|nr:hypothetical protein HXX76_014116 [Chlamydomonas incerta]|eukprot:KAG2424958.1 hypothetical protein HXX76_014116 [Chlamydomonas incerta]